MVKYNFEIIDGSVPDWVSPKLDPARSNLKLSFTGPSIQTLIDLAHSPTMTSLLRSYLHLCNIGNAMMGAYFDPTTGRLTYKQFCTFREFAKEQRKLDQLEHPKQCRLLLYPDDHFLSLFPLEEFPDITTTKDLLRKFRGIQTNRDGHCPYTEEDDQIIPDARGPYAPLINQIYNLHRRLSGLDSNNRFVYVTLSPDDTLSHIINDDGDVINQVQNYLDKLQSGYTAIMVLSLDLSFEKQIIHANYDPKTVSSFATIKANPFDAIEAIYDPGFMIVEMPNGDMAITSKASEGTNIIPLDPKPK